MNIAFIPIDNRPVCYTLVEQITNINKDINIVLPPREMLGGLTQIADIRGLINWLKELKNIDKIILSLDTIAYGGLVPSRRSNDKFKTIKKRIETLKSVLLEKNAEVYAF